MKLSVKVAYACRVLVHMARRHGSGELSHIEDLSRIESVPANYLVQILSELRTGGLIVSRRGKQGGYSLVRPPAEISLLDVMRLVDGDMLELPDMSEGASGARVNDAWQALKRGMEKQASTITLDVLAGAGAGGMYHI